MTAFPFASAPSPAAAVQTVVLALALGGLTLARAGDGAGIGVFDGHGDIGAVSMPGTAAYDPDTQEYALSSSGSNMWTDHDEFHFVWKRVRGDFIIQASTEFLGTGIDPHRKMGLIVRASLDPRSAHVNAARHGSGLTALQFRKVGSGPTEEVRFKVEAPEVLQLERSGRKFTISAARFGDTFANQETEQVELPDEVYVGIYLCAHNNSIVEKAIFRNVRLIRPARPDFRPYSDYIGSDIEILDVTTGIRRTIFHAVDSVQAPNWTPDGKSLIYNHNGRMLSMNLATQEHAPIDTGDQVQCNNDHALSFDGQTLGISSGQPSLIYTLPVTGGVPKRITLQGPSYLHGWSPDGKYLAFTASRNGVFGLYRVPADGGPEELLTSCRSLDDGSEYTPDGQSIYFNSDRSGRMQIWRMNSDGSNPVQVTDDEFNNWFPHVSPDGKTVLFISFPPETRPTDHPFYKRVYLRKVPVEGGKPSTVAYLYGGQGSINVNSWSPDSRTIAFVSNSGAF